MADTEAKGKTLVDRPQKPDEAKYKADLAQAEKEHDQSKAHLNTIKGKLDNASMTKDSPAGKRRAELIAQLQDIRQKQQGSKSSRQTVMDKVKRLDEQLKSRQNELKNARGKLQYKSVEDIDKRVKELQSQVDTGSMKIVDEKKALADISQLNRSKKQFSGFAEQEKAIADIKDQIAQEKAKMNDPEQKQLSEKYNELQEELNKIKASQDADYKTLNSLRDERKKAQDLQNEKWNALKKVKDDYFTAKRSYKQYEDQVYQARRERHRAEREAQENARRKAYAQEKLDEASAPAFAAEIQIAEGLIRHFDPSSVPAAAASGPGKFAATAQRTIDDSGIKGTRISKKDQEEESYFIGGGGKKGKKGKKTAESSEKFSLDLGLIEQLDKVGVNAPSSKAQVSDVVSKLKEKVEHWKKNQAQKTQENIAKAQKEIDRLESEPLDDRSKDSATKVSQKNAGVNGKVDAEKELSQEQDAAADAAEELKKAAIEDKETPEVV